MKILHIISGDLGSGAARGAYWLHKGLVASGIDSKILTNSASISGDARVTSVNSGRLQKMLSMYRSYADLLPLHLYPNRKPLFFSTAFHGYDFTKHPLYAWADIIHLHWINESFVNSRDLARIHKPIVWTLRDMWPLTGGCHHALACERYKCGCGSCYQLASTSRYDLSWLECRRKRKYFPRTIRVVGISDWLSEKARESTVFSGYDIRTVCNNINLEDYFPLDKAVAREMLGITTGKKIILLGAQRLTEHYKGFDKFIEALQYLDKDRYYLAFFGRLEEKPVEASGFEFKTFGFLHDALSLRVLYAAADVFAAPSIVDSFGKTLAESMACGTPVVCFDATGPKDIVDHKINGYKAHPFDAADLAAGIDYVTTTPDGPELSRNARDKAVKEYDSKTAAQRYIRLYEEITAEGTGRD